MGQRFKSLFKDDKEYYQKAVDDAKDHFAEEYGASLRVIANEDSSFMRFLSFFHRLIGNKGWLENTAMAWWLTAWALKGQPTVYMPRRIIGTSQGSFTMTHEVVHLEQMAKYTTLGFLVAYFLLWLPVGFSLRLKLELQAYRSQILAITCYAGVGAASQFSKIVLDSLLSKRYLWPSFNRQMVHQVLLDCCSDAAKRDAAIEAELYMLDSEIQSAAKRMWQLYDKDMTTLGSA